MEVAHHNITLPQPAVDSAGANVEQLPRQLRSNRPPIYPPEEVQAGATGLFHTKGQMCANLYAENLFDKQYIANSIYENSLFPGAPINARAQIGFVY